MNGQLYIIDAFSLIFQVYHALPEMTGPKGQPTNAVFGTVRDLITILENKRPSHLIIAMDSPEAGVRNEWYADYKANRAEMPDDLSPQIPLIVELFKGYRIPVIQHAGWEADDVIATVARRAVEAGLDVCVVTSDKDIRQLLGPKVRHLQRSQRRVFRRRRSAQTMGRSSRTGDRLSSIGGGQRR